MEKERILYLPEILGSGQLALTSASVYSLSFFIPFLIGHPQWLVGIIVNICLFISAIFLPRRLYFPVLIFPSLAVLLRGVIFGPFTPFLAYFLPFIWLSNYLLIIVFKKVFHSNYFLAVFSASGAKYLLLFTSALLYFKLGLVPEVFLSIMGLNQLATSLAAGFLSFLIFTIYGQHISGSRKST